MSEFVAVGKTEDFHAGSMKVVKVDGRELCVTKVDDGYYAFINLCTHAQQPMSFGYVKGKEAVCIFHWAIFDATNGEVLQGPAAKPLQTFEVRVEDGQVLIGGPIEEATI